MNSGPCIKSHEQLTWGSFTQQFKPSVAAGAPLFVVHMDLQNSLKYSVFCEAFLKK